MVPIPEALKNYKLLWVEDHMAHVSNAWERKILSRICGPVAEQGIWKIRSNQELQELYRDLDIVTDIKKRRLEWICNKNEAQKDSKEDT
jgi:hypothetical protein